MYKQLTWIMVGLLGEVIVALFNIGSSTTTVTVALDVVLQHVNRHGHTSSAAQQVGLNNLESVWECYIKDGWEDTNIKVAREFLSTSVPTHGTVLSIMLSCRRDRKLVPPPSVP